MADNMRMEWQTAKQLYLSNRTFAQQNDNSDRAVGLLDLCRCMLARLLHLPLLTVAVLNSSICNGLPGPLLAGSRGNQTVQALLLLLKPSSPLLPKPFGAALVKLWRFGLQLGQQYERQLRHGYII